MAPRADKAKAKTAGKIARAKNKIARKCGNAKSAVKAVRVAVLAILASVLCGCASTGSQPAKSQTQTNDVSIDFAGATVNFAVYLPSAGKAESVPLFEAFTMAQSQESSGTESYAQTATPTNTTDLKADVRYNDALSAASSTSKGVLAAIGSGLDSVLALMQSKQTGSVQVTKTDGTTATVDCKDGQCSFSDCTDGVCNPTP